MHNQSPARGANSDAAVVGADVADWLAQIFLEAEPQVQIAFRTAIAAGQPAKVAFEAHRLKGSAGAVGATALAALCNEMEQRTKVGSMDRVEDLFKSIDVELRAVRAALERIRGAAARS